MEAKETNFLRFLNSPKQLVIPIYQRTYSWKLKECEQLWKDLVKAGNDEDISGHFVGSIVYVEKGLYQVSALPRLLVIDGQQRLTTLSLLLSALCNHIKEKKIQSELNPDRLASYYLFNDKEEGEEKLNSDSIIIKEEQAYDGINIISINSLPASAKKITSNRREIYEYGKFMIKSADKQKFSSEDKTDIDELKLEILAVRKFKDRVLMLEKIAIVKQDSGKVFLIEELLVPYDKFKEDTLLKNRALLLLEEAKNIFKNGDFKVENIAYDISEAKLVFTDVFPSEAHLINIKEET